MKAVRIVNFKVRNNEGEIKYVKVDKKEFVKLAAGLKKAGYKIIKNSISISDTIVIGNTNIIKMKRAA